MPLCKYDFWVSISYKFTRSYNSFNNFVYKVLEILKNCVGKHATLTDENVLII